MPSDVQSRTDKREQKKARLWELRIISGVSVESERVP